MNHTNHYVALVPKLPLPSQPDGLNNQDKSIPLTPKIAKRWTTTVLDTIKYLAEKVKQVTLFIFKASFSVFLYWINPSLFAMGFVGGIAWDDTVQRTIGKIQGAWQHLSCFETVVGCFFCGLSLPVTIATTTVLWSAYLGAAASQRSAIHIRG